MPYVGLMMAAGDGSRNNLIQSHMPADEDRKLNIGKYKINLRERTNMNRWNLKTSVAALALIASSASFAAPMNFDVNITGADMAGMGVTAYFVGGGSQSLIWSILSTAPGVDENDIPGQEGNSGGVSGLGWSLTQQGYTQGEVVGSNVYGAWTFTDNSVAGIQSLVIDATGTNIVFDTVFLDDLADDLNGSSQGRPFTPFIGLNAYAGASGLYSSLVVDELFKTLTITMQNPGTSFKFLADTDASVPEPATLFLLSAGLLGMAGLRRRSSEV